MLRFEHKAKPKRSRVPILLLNHWNNRKSNEADSCSWIVLQGLGTKDDRKTKQLTSALLVLASRRGEEPSFQGKKYPSNNEIIRAFLAHVDHTQSNLTISWLCTPRNCCLLLTRRYRSLLLLKDHCLCFLTHPIKLTHLLLALPPPITRELIRSGLNSQYITDLKKTLLLFTLKLLLKKKKSHPYATNRSPQLAL